MANDFIVNSNTGLPYSFDELKSEILLNLRTYDQWKDAEITDSVIEMMIHIMGYYTNFTISNINRTFIDYFPHLTQAYKSLEHFSNFIGMQINGLTTASGTINFYQLTPLTVKVRIPFHTEVSKGDIIYSTIEEKYIEIGQTNTDVAVIQGQFKSLDYISSGLENQNYYIIRNVDINYLSLKVNNIAWERVNNFLLSTNTSKHYVINIINNGIVIKFGNGLFGLIPQTDTVINVSYLETKGTQGHINGIDEVKTINTTIYDINGNIYNDLKVKNTTVIQNGYDGDTVDSLNKRITSYFQTNPFISRKSDYISYIKAHSIVQDCDVYAGWEVSDNSKYFASVILIVKPKNTLNLTDTERETLTKYIKEKDFFITKIEYRDIDYIDVETEINLKFKTALNAVEINNIKSEVNTIITDYFDFNKVIATNGTIFKDVYKSDITDDITAITQVKKCNIYFKSVETIGVIASNGAYNKTLIFWNFLTPDIYWGATKVGSFNSSNVFTAETAFTGKVTATLVSPNILTVTVVNNTGYVGSNIYIKGYPENQDDIIRNDKTTVLKYFNHTISLE